MRITSIAALACLFVLAPAGCSQPPPRERNIVLSSQETGRIVISDVAGNSKILLGDLPTSMFVRVVNPADVMRLRALLRSRPAIRSMLIDDFGDNMHYTLSGVRLRSFRPPNGVAFKVAHFALVCGPPTCATQQHIP